MPRGLSQSGAKQFSPFYKTPLFLFSLGGWGEKWLDELFHLPQTNFIHLLIEDAASTQCPTTIQSTVIEGLKHKSATPDFLNHLDLDYMYSLHSKKHYESYNICQWNPSIKATCYTQNTRQMPNLCAKHTFLKISEFLRQPNAPTYTSI